MWFYWAAMSDSQAVASSAGLSGLALERWKQKAPAFRARADGVLECGALRFPSPSWAESLPQRAKQPIIVRIVGDGFGGMLLDLGHRGQDRSVGRASDGRQGVLLRLSASDADQGPAGRRLLDAGEVNPGQHVS
jgi:hypothetical protein